MRRVFLTKAAVLVKLKLIWCVPLILCCSVIALLTFRAGKRYDIPHDDILAPLFALEDSGMIVN